MTLRFWRRKRDEYPPWKQYMPTIKISGVEVEFVYRDELTYPDPSEFKRTFFDG